MKQHEPVLLAEVLEYLNIQASGTYIDCTGGFGGHSQKILEKLDSHGTLILCDYYKESVEFLKNKFCDDNRVTVYHERFSQIFDKLDKKFDGILADFGISSPQLADEKLGIGFLKEDAPLDMRIDFRLEQTAADILNEWNAEELADIFFYYGGERASRKIASAVVECRQNKKFEVVRDLTDLCEKEIGRFYYKKRLNPATKVFQALRIVVNHELKEIETFLDKAPLALNKNGRLVTISFHEGEDRLVKKHFRELDKIEDFKLVRRKAFQPTREEILSNPRSRSARMRVLQKQI